MFGAPILFIVLATAWSALVIELVIESARTGARDLVAFGYVLAAPEAPSVSGSCVECRPPLRSPW